MSHSADPSNEIDALGLSLDSDILADSHGVTESIALECNTAGSLDLPEASPFDQFKIDSAHDVALGGRFKCGNCLRSFKLICPKCNVPLGHTPPHVDLPVSLDIYRHPSELIGKTTSTHAKLVADDQTEIYVDRLAKGDHKSLAQRYPDPKRVLLLYPSWDSVTLDQVEPGSFDKLVVIDGTWKQSRNMANVLSGCGFRPVRIAARKTLFWRYQPHDDFHLATIEAIYYFYRDYYSAFLESTAGPYDGRYDNLLFYFKVNFDVIQSYYRRNPERNFTSRKLGHDRYINYGSDEPADGNAGEEQEPLSDEHGAEAELGDEDGSSCGSLELVGDLAKDSQL
ncbi:DTW domain-containing protein [Polychytrium aggregatum]|uniref:DTW domain-containing protein n=1 Tax=Polychytrium aggregatum TaxID=110093 RepID=UPI0022FE9700|nr:DTW domain-containing protein [Polychytrium aggregatum]KAI9199287.1 DTW domain-containing protein [Polychytrium aggregatum]